MDGEALIFYYSTQKELFKNEE